MDYKQILNIAVLAGEIMLRSGAETYRVEDTMKHILNTAGTEVAEAFVMMTGIVATLDNQDMEMLTAMRRVHDRGTNMHRIVQVNEISRRYCRGGGVKETLVSAAVGCILAFLITLGKKIQMSSFILNAICAFGVAVTAACVNRVTSGWNLDIVIISSLMPLVPGVAITNAIRDTLRGDYISGGARILEAFLTAAAIGLGAGTGMIFVGGIV